MSDHRIYDLAQRDHERLTADIARLRSELAAVELEQRTVATFIEQFHAYERAATAESTPAPATSPAPGADTALPRFTALPGGRDSDADHGERTADAPAIQHEPAEVVDAPQAQAYLALGEPGRERRIPITSTPLRIGSGEHCDLVLPDSPGIAEEHAVVWLAGPELLLHAGCGDTAVTVSGRTMSWASLDDGDVIDFPGFPMRVSLTLPPALAERMAG